MNTRKYRGQHSFPLSAALGLFFAAVLIVLFITLGGGQPS